MSDPDFHPTEWLGFAINVLDKKTVIPLRPQTLVANDSLIRARRAVKMSANTRSHTWSQTGATWAVPDNVDCNDDFGEFNQKIYIFSSGKEVTNSLSASASVSAGYMGVSVSGGVSYDSTEQFDDNTSYAFVVKSKTGYSASLVARTENVNPKLVEDAKNLPEYDHTKDDVRHNYRSFFSQYGTHVIHYTEHGWHYQLQCSQDSSSVSSSKSFQANISVKYMGNGADASFKQSSDYKTFEQNSTTIVSAIGGDAGSAANMQSDPSNMDAKQTWEDSIGTKSDEGLFLIKVKPIGEIFKDLDDDTLGTYAKLRTKLDKALLDLSENCRRRVSVMFPTFPVIDPVTVISNSIAGKPTPPQPVVFGSLIMSIESTNGRFVPLMVTDEEKTSTLVEANGDRQYFDGQTQIGCWADIVAGFSDISITFESPWEGWKWDWLGRPSSGEFEFKLEKYGLDGMVLCDSVKRVCTIASVTPKQSPAVTLQMRPELDFL